MAYSGREKNSYQHLAYQTKKAPNDILAPSLGSNNRSLKYETYLMDINSSVFEAETILSQLNGEYKNILSTSIYDENKKILEKYTLIQETLSKMEILNLLLKLLEKSSKSVYTDSQHLILSQSAYNCLEEVYLDDPNDVVRKNELTKLKDEGFIKIVDSLIYFDTFSEDVYSPYVELGASKMLDIINIKDMKDRIGAIIDRYNEETIIPWMAKATPLIEIANYLTDDSINNVLPDNLVTLSIGKSKHIEVEQSLSDDVTPPIQYEENIEVWKKS